MVNSRKYYLDILRIIAIIQVINIHVTARFFNDKQIFGKYEWWSANIIDSLSRTGVPIFIMISGALLLGNKSEEKMSKFFEKRFSRILIPFLFFSAFYYVVYNDSTVTFKNIGNFILALIQNNVYYHLWFMYTIIGLYLVVPIIRIYVNNANGKQLLYFEILCWISGGALPIINQIFKINISLVIPVVGGAVGLFILGYILDNKNFSKKIRYGIYLCSLISILITILGTFIISEETGEISQVLFNNWGMNIIIMASALFIFIKQILIKYSIKDCIIKIIFVSISNLSFGIYLIHIHILTLLENGKIPLLLPQNMPSTLLGLTCRTFCVFIISYFIIYCISKIKYINRVV